VFDPGTRAQVREWLLDRARADDHVTAAALVGSAASGGQDEWSDIDLAVRLADGADPVTVAGDWSAGLRERFAVVDQLDVWSGETLFRVFLLEDTLQVDVSFWPGSRFAASGGPFRLVFGETNPPSPPRAPAARDMVGMGWLYALHVRSSLARGRHWQALHMINGMRDQIIELACARHSLPFAQGRGVDDLPAIIRLHLQQTLPGSLDQDQLLIAFERLADALLAEVGYLDTELTSRLTNPLRELIRTSRSHLDQ
jgi:predicted nucleotidyltransferase